MSEQQTIKETAMTETVERISTIMKQVDELVKKKDYDIALKKVRVVLQQDVKNIYARAYEERILALILESRKEELSAETEKRVAERVEMEVQQRLKEFQKQQELEILKKRQLEKREEELEKNARKVSNEERQTLSQKGFADFEKEISKRMSELEVQLRFQMEKSLREEQHKLEAESKQRITEFTLALQRTTERAGGQQSSEELEILQVKREYEEKLHKAKEHFEKKVLKTLDEQRQTIEKDAFAKLSEEHQAAIERLTIHSEQERLEAVKQEQEKAKHRELEAYKFLMISMNTLALEETIQHALLYSVRTSLNILPDEHASVVRSVRIHAYVSALKSVWQKGKPNEEEATMLEDLRSLYQLSEGEHERMLKTVKKELGIPDDSAVILAIDDDDMILQFIEHILKQTYTTVLTAHSVDEALPMISERNPSIILCDVHLQSPGIGGFAFYQNIIKGEYGSEVKTIPYVLMSSISDEFFINGAKQLGVTSYLPKPFTRESLQTTIQSALTAQTEKAS